MDKTNLPPLPEPGINTANHAHVRVKGYTAEQMHERDRMWLAKLEAARAVREAGAGAVNEQLAHEIADGLASFRNIDGKLRDDLLMILRCKKPLYRHPGPQQPDEVARFWREAFTNERAMRYMDEGMKAEQARIHAETDASAVIAALNAAQEAGHD